MNKRVLYRKEIDLLLLAKKNLQSFELYNYVRSVRDAIPDLFYDGGFDLKGEFVEIIPVDRLSEIRGLLEFLKQITSGDQDKVFSLASGQRRTREIIDGIDSLCSLMKEQISLHSNFTVFYSWQSDLPSRENRNFIEKSIIAAINALNDDSDIKLILDKNTRNVPGSPDIANTIFTKIDGAVAFVADVTPIVKAGEKQVPNPNVMCELGYALSSLSDERVIFVCNQKYCDNLRDLPFDLGLKRVTAYDLTDDSKANKKTQKQYLTSCLTDALKAIRDL